MNYLFKLENINSNEVIELFEDVEGIKVEIFQEWNNEIYYKTINKEIQPILKLGKLNVGKNIL